MTHNTHIKSHSTSETSLSRFSCWSMNASDMPESKKVSATNPSRWRFWAAFTCLCVVNLVCALDATSLSVALPIIAKALNGSGVEAFWSGTSFLLTATVFQPSFAALSHVFGRKPMLLVALTFFTAGAIVGAISKDFATLLAGRSVQGVGGGGIQALTNVVITDMIPLKERGKYLGIITMNWAIGSVAGPIIGGVLAEKASWRWIFWLNLPFCAVAYIMIPIFLNLKYKPGNFIEKLKQVDWVGSVLFVGATTSLLIPITWGGTMYPWTHWRTIAPLAAGVAGLLLFSLWSRFMTKNPILSASLFKSRTSLSNYFSIVVHGMFQWSVLYYMPLYFESAQSLSPIQSGIALFPWTFTIAPTAVIIGVLIARTGRYRWAIWSGWVLTAAGVGLLILFRADTPASTWIPLALVSGLGLGVLYPAMSLCNQAAAADVDMAAAAALNPFFRNYGQMLGVAVGGAVVQNFMRRNLESSADRALAERAAQISKDISALVERVKDMRNGSPVDQALRMELIDAYCNSLRMLWIVMGVLACVALLASVIFTKAYSLERDLETDQGFVNTVKKVGDEEEEEK